YIFSLKKNGVEVQRGSNTEMIFDLPALIANVERYMQLEDGDLLFTGTPAGVGRITAGDRLEGFLNGESIFVVEVKDAVAR
ncbi:MAG TPA: fumarylacetoacetate hydrolase family protein, partial [Flavobacteriales bacterium]|nr:fumarylacetoacetate hydrolase family protein [Flavobacteriales bacterium]